MFDAEDYLPVLHILEKFFADSICGKKVRELADVEKLKQRVDLELPQQGKSDQELQAIVEEYLKYAVKTSHPLFLNQLWGGFHKAGIIGDLVSSAANTSMYTTEVAPLATLIEKALVKKMGSLAGFDDPEGQFTTGGSNGNLMAMMMARQKAFPQGKLKGHFDHAPMIVFASEDAHYSAAKAAHILGLGSEQVWKVRGDEQGAMDPVHLRERIEEAQQQNLVPIMVHATAGTTVRGAFDPIDALADVAEDFGIWLHVDGAWGGAVLLSKQHRHLLQGLERADSFVWDAHKMMGLSLTCSVLLVRERGWMHPTFSTDGTDYLFHDDESERRDLGPSTMHCGRRADALKLWFAWQSRGDEGWEERVNHFMALASRAEQLVNDHPRLRMVCERSFANVCFQYVPEAEHLDVNDFTVRLRKRLFQDGRVLVNYASVGQQKAIRLVVCNQSLTAKDLEVFFEEILRLGQELESA